MSDRYWIMASQIKCGSCDSALGGSGRGLGGGAFLGWHIIKYPARLMLKCVYFKKLYFREKAKYTRTFNNNCGGARWID